MSDKIALQERLDAASPAALPPIGPRRFTGKGDILCTSLLVLAAAFAAQPAAAQEVDVEGRIGLASEYVGKGLGKSDGVVAPFAEIGASLNGFYVNAFASDAASSKGADAEVILAVGWAGEVQGFDVDAQVMRREMLGEISGYDSVYTEYQVDVSRDFGAGWAGRLRVNYSSDGYGPSREAWWVEAQATVRLTGADKLSFAVADRTSENGSDYTAWNIGVKHRFTPEISGDLRWYDTDAHDLGDRYDGRLVAALTYSF
jgi:uncharacterized protein (TIGR02001 family)